MPVPTPELGLSQAVDADDTADYLVTNLANSLVSVDALFNNASGHTHGGVHQGGPISNIPASAIPLGSITSAMIADGTIQSADLAAGCVTSAKIAPPIDIGGMFRTTGMVGEGEGTGPGLEIFYNGSACYLQGFDRSTSLYMPIMAVGTRITLSINGGSNVVVDTSGNVEMSGALTVTAGVYGAVFYVGDATHFIEPSGRNNVYACPSGGSHIFEFNVGNYAPVITGVLTVNGAATISTTLNVSGITTVPQLNLGAGGQYILPVNTSIRYATAGGPHSFELASGGLAPLNCATLGVTGDINVSGTVTAGANLASAGYTASGGQVTAYNARNGSNLNAFLAPNVANYQGQGLAQSWGTWSCVDHARQYGVTAQAIDDPLGKLRAIPVYYYDHISMDPATDTPVRTPDGTFDSSMTYGMSAAEVEAVVPELAGENNVDYGRLMTILWAACQLLDSRLTAVEGAAA